MIMLRFFYFLCLYLPVAVPSEVDSSEVIWLEELEDHQPPEGFVVARGLYKGPIIRR
jgi:plant cysteine oxidase